MSKKYKIKDFANGLFAKDAEVFAENPTAALKAAGYNFIERDYTGKRGNAIVYGCYGRRGSYVYFASK